MNLSDEELGMRPSVAASPQRERSNLADELDRLMGIIDTLESDIWQRTQNKLGYILGPDMRVSAVSNPDLAQLKSVNNDSEAITQVLLMQEKIHKFSREMTAVLDRVQL